MVPVVLRSSKNYKNILLKFVGSQKISRLCFQLHVNQSRPFLQAMPQSRSSTENDVTTDHDDETTSDVMTDRSRSNVVMEIVLAEREYVKHLRDVVVVRTVCPLSIGCF